MCSPILSNIATGTAPRGAPDGDRALRLRNNQVLERPEPLEQLLLQAHQVQRSGKVDETIKLFRAALPLLQQAIIIAPDRHDFFNDLGMLFQDQGELKKAVSFHNRALKLKPDFAPAFINLGVAYKRLSKFTEAIAAYRKAIKLQPNMPEAHNNLGNLLRVTDNLAGTHKELLQALALRPGYKDAAENLSAVERQLKESSPVLGKAAKTVKVKTPAKPAAGAKTMASSAKKSTP
jgi:Flp pilus assembly protein TadD